MDAADVPQWKKDLIARLRSQNKRTATAQQLVLPSPSSSSSVQQPVAVGSGEKCDSGGGKMVQERSWEPQRGDDEDLHYGPGIVSKLKERYLSLAQRENKVRPTVLRKAASLENILDDAQEQHQGGRMFQAKRNDGGKNAGTDRYRKAKRGSELKRARSVETISSSEDRDILKEPKRESLHEEMLLIAKGNELIIPEKPIENPPPAYTPRVNRPKRIAPVMNEKEKPPADVVKQAKMIFERRPEQRTRPPQQTGEVAAKVATYKSIIVQNKAAKKPTIKVKPIINGEKPKTNGLRTKREAISDVSPPGSPRKPLETSSPVSPKKGQQDVAVSTPLPSPIPDISRVDFKVEAEGTKSTSLTETPDLIITSTPVPVVNSPSFRISATENFIKEEIRLASTDRTPPTQPPAKPATNVPKKPPPQSPTPQSPTPNSINFSFVNKSQNNHHQLLPLNKNVLNTQTPPSQPLKVEINGVAAETKKQQPPLSPKPNLTIHEIEKNLINTAKSLEQQQLQPPQPKPKSSVITKCAEEVTVVVNKVPKVKKQPPREPENNSLVFSFVDRKDVPDHVPNDGAKRVSKPEKPKVGEGGIILLPGASIGESFTDEDEEILRSLECPPSPCDVAFINDNILIDGKSSLSQKTKRAKLKISFVDGPDIYEYPSESSLIEESPKSPPASKIGHSVPSITGTSSLANYTPKGTENFQPGVTRILVQSMPISKPNTVDSTDLILSEIEKPILFSSGANSDILF